ncbi:c-type cytochrome [Hymenobacter monticola]|uniref:Cytochrome c n=1 Tax=Hymenobacter monticola TaxID=1705399 RepID=A0ABY4B3Y8_9BACT|nr:cytochrome c [Hymenobacter monticola]UOE33705.1 cytochrome c [Hymenobacter monticola]
MWFKSVGFALSVGMALVVVLIGFTLLSAAGLAGFSANDVAQASEPELQEVGMLPASQTAAPSPAASPAEAAEIAAGDALFKGNCAQCHAVNEQVVGPALAGISKRRPVSWLIPWIKNSSKVVASGDDYAVALFNKFNKQQMPSFALSDKEITSIIAYVKSEEGGAAAPAAVAMVSE